MSQENVDIARRAYEQFIAGDMEPVLDLFSPDAKLADSGGLGIEGTAAGTRTGPAGFMRATEETREAFDEYTVEPLEFIDAGDAVVVDARMSGRGRASGLSVDTRVAHLWVFREGKIVRGEVYRTTEEALDAARRPTE
jgi:ketosteroid isomerase-like protein